MCTSAHAACMHVHLFTLCNVHAQCTFICMTSMHVHACVQDPITAESGKMFLSFTTDGSVNEDGFVASYSA